MRLPGSDRDCGPLLELGHIQRRLQLGAPVAEGVETIAVAEIVGTVGRARDFDGCFRPLRPELQKRVNEIERANPTSLDEPIDVVRVDRAFFVSDGHKRVSIAHQSGREFIDARISHVATRYAVSADVEEEAIERTAREGEFRRHSGLAAGVPNARFALSDIGAYGELLLAVQSYAYDRTQAMGRLLPAAEAARVWYEEKYLPTLARARDAVGDLLESCSDADLFLAMHRQERGSWGSECSDPECIPDMLLADQRRTALTERFALGRVLGRGTHPRSETPLLLPLTDDTDG